MKFTGIFKHRLGISIYAKQTVNSINKPVRDSRSNKSRARATTRLTKQKSSEERTHQLRLIWTLQKASKLLADIERSYWSSLSDTLEKSKHRRHPAPFSVPGRTEVESSESQGDMTDVKIWDEGMIVSGGNSDASYPHPDR